MKFVTVVIVPVIQPERVYVELTRPDIELQFKKEESMTKPALKLVKTKKKSEVKQKPKANGRQPYISHPLSQTSSLRPSILTPAERAEAARFRALTKQRAARQAKVRRILAKLNELDNWPPNAA